MADPAAHRERLVAAGELLRLGLGLPACEMLEQADPERVPAPVLGALREQASARSGRRSWSRYATTYAANLRALERRGACLDEIRAAWSAIQDDCQVFEDNHGAVHVRVKAAAGWRWWPAFDDHRIAAAAAPLPADHAQLMPGPYAFDGIGLGWYFERVWRATRNTFLGYSPALYWVEPNALAVAIALHLHDWQELLSDEAVMIFAGRGAGSRFRETLLSDSDLPPPVLLFSAPSRPPADPEQGACRRADVAAIVAEVVRVRAARAAESFRGIEAVYANRDARYWASRFASALREGPRPTTDPAAAPLRILGSVSTHTSFLQYSMRDALRAFEQLGCRTKLLIESRPFERIGAATWHRVIEEFQPDLFFVIDHLRTSFVGKIPRNLPQMTWDQDALTHLFNADTIRRMGPLDTVVGLPQFELIGRGGCDPDAFLPAHMATSPERFDVQALSDDEQARYRCDVSYVSHASQTADEFHVAERAKCRDRHVRRLLDHVFPLAVAQVREHGAVSGGVMQRLLLDAEQRCGLRVTDADLRHRLLSWYIWRLCDRVFRHQALEWVARWAQRTGRSFRIYGNGWERHPSLSSFAAGPAENGRELLCVYRASAINLQLMPAGFLHQRALDGILAGGFFLARQTMADRRDPRLTPLAQAIARRGLRSAAALRASGDADLTATFDAVRESLGHADEEAEKTFHFVRCDAQLDYPCDVFPCFAQIVFRDAASFEQAAETFLAAPARRTEIVAAMRRIVTERYSYQATMRKFLMFAADYLAKATGAAEATRCADRP